MKIIVTGASGMVDSEAKTENALLKLPFKIIYSKTCGILPVAKSKIILLY